MTAAETLAGRAIALQQRLAETQWLAPAQIAAMQARAITPLLEHAWRTVPAQRARLEAVGYRPGAPLSTEAWRALAPQSRREMQLDPVAWASTAPPPEHGEIVRAASSGSTGTPLAVLGTVHDALIAKAFTLRAMLWHDIDLEATLAIIRKHADGQAEWPEGDRAARWGDEATYPFPTGPSVSLDVKVPTDRQLEWLARTGARYLLAYPSILRAYGSAHGGLRPALDRVITVSEALGDDDRAITREVLGAEIIDAYSAREAGPIALQCPDAPAGAAHYHVQAERILMEIVDDAGAPVAPGEAGRVLLTGLHNYAQPLIRYDIGDIAVQGPPSCGCGRGLPVVSRIKGRVRNMLIGPGGARFWPSFMTSGLIGRLPLLQHQFIQRSVASVVDGREVPARLECHLVVARPLTGEEEELIRSRLESRLHGPWSIEFRYRDSIARAPSGKYEDCFVALED